MNPGQYPKRLIEVDLPIKRISAHSRREKSIRHGHISTLHIWWARRPLAACRAVICAALWPDPADLLCPQSFRDAGARIITEFARCVCGQGKILTSNLSATCSEESRQRWEHLAKAHSPLDPADKDHQNILRFSLLDFIADFANWDNSTVPEYLETARALTQAAHEALGGEPGTRPLVVDPFAGGGSIPLEALRVGADAFASDLNPVAVLLNKVVLEYIPKYGQRLADEVRKWGKWIKEQIEKELAAFYPPDPDGAAPHAYIWARTIFSEAPDVVDTPIEVPLMRSLWLAKKKGRYFALRWIRNDRGQVQTRIANVTYSKGDSRTIRQPLLEVFQPQSPGEVEKGTSSGGAAICPVTGYTTTVEAVRKQLKERTGGAADARLICVVTTSPKISGKSYRLPTERDFAAVQKAAKNLQLLQQHHQTPQALIPEEPLNHLRGFFNVVLYGMTRWGDLFSPRQALALTTLVRLVREAGQLADAELKIATQTLLALALDRCVDKCASVVVWNIPAEKVEHVFGRQALPMVWDFVEANILSDIGWLGACEWVAKVIDCTSAIGNRCGTTAMASARSHLLPNAAAEAVVTDPPYYAAIPYADLSDFFFTWLKRSVGDLHPELFQSNLAPKDEECVSLAHRAAMYRNKDGPWFEQQMTDACHEIQRITKLSGIGVVVFANKETSGWEAMLSALISSAWVVTASWPIDTERGGRLRAMNSAALASSVHLVCRPRDGKAVGDWRDVLADLPKRIHDWMPRLASEGIVGADAIFACLGPALEIFSRYARVEKASGDRVELKEYLEHVWAAVAKEAMSLIFAGADATGFEPDSRLTAMWFWTLSAGANGKSGTAEESEDEGEPDEADPGKVPIAGGFVLEYDVARKIAQGLGAHLEQLASVVGVKGDKARLLPVSERARHLFGKDEGKAPPKRSKKAKQLTLFDEPGNDDNEEGGWGEMNVPQLGATILDRLHQGMILFAAGRSEALKRFLVEEGVGQDARFWRLAQALSALYPGGTEEKRWVDGVLARKKGLGF